MGWSWGRAVQILRYRWEGPFEEAPGVGQLLGSRPDRARHAYRILCVLSATPGERPGGPCLRMKLAVERVGLRRPALSRRSPVRVAFNGPDGRCNPRFFL
jgi:hypothetical protein